jgi:hypothetical protein
MGNFWTWIVGLSTYTNDFLNENVQMNQILQFEKEVARSLLYVPGSKNKYRRILKFR